MSDDQELSVDTDKSVNGLPNAPKDLNSLSELEDDEKELNFNRLPETPYLIEKAKIIEADIEKGTNIERLKKFAKSDGGFVNDVLRRKCWPLVLGIDPNVEEIVDGSNDQEAILKHPEYHQVVLDVNRSLKRFPPGIPYQKRIALQNQLTRLIIRVITKYPHLRYYQGYHDVAVTFLLVVGEELAFRIMEKLSTEHLRDCMEPTMEKTSHLLNYIYPLIKRLNPVLHEFMMRSTVGTMFCLPWFLTWFGHNLNHYTDVVRLYDFFLAMPPLAPLYLSAALVAHRHSEILITDCEMASIHCLLSQIPDELPFQKLIQDTIELYEKFPPAAVEAEVIEMTRREKEERNREMAKRRGGQRRGWAVARWVPKGRGQLIIIVLSVAFGLYAYLRAENSQLPMR